MNFFSFGTSKINTFFFLHKELIKVLDVVFTGFKSGQHVFYQPDSALFAPNYDLLINRYGFLFQDNEILNYIVSKNYVFTSISNFYSLTDSYEANIKCWNDERIILLAEKQFIEKIMPIDEGVEKDVKLAAYELEKLFPEHQKLKNAFLTSIKPKKLARSNKIILDTSTATLTIDGKSRSIQLNTNVMIFLQTCIEYGGTIVGYKVLADKMALNANRSDFTDKEIAPEVHDVKKLLNRKLRELGFDSKRIQHVMRSIQYQRGVGYKFVNSPR